MHRRRRRQDVQQADEDRGEDGRRLFPDSGGSPAVPVLRGCQIFRTGRFDVNLDGLLALVNLHDGRLAPDFLLNKIFLLFFLIGGDSTKRQKNGLVAKERLGIKTNNCCFSFLHGT